MKRFALTLIFTLLLAPAVQAQEATTELYGDFRYSYNRADAGDSLHWAGVNNASRFGVRAEVTGTGLTVFADLQTGIGVGETGAAFTQRFYLAGARGPFGSLTLGRHSTAYKMAGLRLDPFYDTSTLSAGGAVPVTGLFAGASFGLSNLTNGWSDRALAYRSPSVGGFTGQIAAYLDTDSDHDYGLGLGYSGGGLEAGVHYYDVGAGRTWVQSSGLDHALRFHGSYGRERWSVGASWERVDAGNDDRQDFVFAAGTLDATPALTFAVAVGHVEEGPVQPVAGTGVHLGTFYSLLPQARLHALYSWLDRSTGPSRGNVALGLTYRFTLGQPSS